jgi:hypothetical protein
MTPPTPPVTPPPSSEQELVATKAGEQRTWVISDEDDPTSCFPFRFW